jgi:mono/diheme cytochrome c family protein
MQNAHMTSHALVRAGGATLVVLAVVAGFTLERRPAAQATRQPDRAALVARGDYLTHSVAMCVQCHSPRDGRGNILTAEEFKGAPIPVQGPAWLPDWAIRTPAIAGLPGMTDEQVISILTTGRTADRDPPRRPMPPFRLSREDAEAVVAYLRTR